MGLETATRPNDDEYARLHEEALLVNAGYDEAAELGIRDLANEQILAHGRVYSVAEALTQCDEFGKQIRATAKMLDSLGISKEVQKEKIKESIMEKAEEARNVEIPKTNPEGVKKN